LPQTLNIRPEEILKKCLIESIDRDSLATMKVDKYQVL